MTSKTPFYYKQIGNKIVILDRKTHFPIYIYSKTNTKTDIIRDKNNNMEVYFIHLYHKVIEEKEVTYKFICTLLIDVTNKLLIKKKHKNKLKGE